MVRTLDRLRAAVEALDTDLVHQILVLIKRADPQIAKATWAAYQPSFSFNAEGLMFAGVVALTLWLLFMLSWVAMGASLGWLRRVRA
jgi:hypothetical protein